MERHLEDESTKLVTFVLGDEEFAFDILYVKEIMRVCEITKVPKSKEFIEGVINLRGNVIPIIDLRKRFNMEPRPYTRTTRIIVLEIDDITVGAIVDAVMETKQISNSCIEPPSSIVVGGMEVECIAGVAKLEDRLISLLHVDKIISFYEHEG